ncbi:hypothetical protein CHARACLAT_029372 [Characodon lateralis]|uniref:Uncharacterized protein n=1 Tax=Characodon lateralis TaxID=208331 RepID=A0ABU7E5X6_9TELE|nr:hypothetical protein [Characodon lateralis]
MVNIDLLEEFLKYTTAACQHSSDSSDSSTISASACRCTDGKQSKVAHGRIRSFSAWCKVSLKGRRRRTSGRNQREPLPHASRNVTGGATQHWNLLQGQAKIEEVL